MRDPIPTFCSGFDEVFSSCTAAWKACGFQHPGNDFKRVRAAMQRDGSAEYQGRVFASTAAFDELRKLASRRRMRIIQLADGTVGNFPGGRRPANEPGMSYATMRRWLLTPARKRPPLGADGQPQWRTA